MLDGAGIVRRRHDDGDGNHSRAEDAMTRFVQLASNVDVFR